MLQLTQVSLEMFVMNAYSLPSLYLSFCVCTLTQTLTCSSSVLFSPLLETGSPGPEPIH